MSPIERLKELVGRATAGKLSSAYEGSGDYALFAEGVEIAIVMQPEGGSGFLGGGPADENESNAALLVKGWNVTKALASDDAVEVVARAMVVTIWDPSDPEGIERAIHGDNSANMDFVEIAESALSAILSDVLGEE